MKPMWEKLEYILQDSMNRLTPISPTTDELPAMKLRAEASPDP